jgi:glycerol-3-phosphate dehydrogenase
VGPAGAGRATKTLIGLWQARASMASGTFDRPSGLRRLADQRFDVLVIGGGITGAGVALDAAARGLRAALVEKEDFASGTSSRSSKLVHGGLRYLQRGEIGLVHEGLAERQLLLANAPHLVEPLALVIPLFDRGLGGRLSALGVSGALWGYDLAGGRRIGKRHRRLGRDEVLSRLPTLRGRRVSAGLEYWDGHTDDARLTLAVARTAALDHGATVVNHARVTELLASPGGRVTGARVVVAPDAETIDVCATVVVNAAGVWADQVQALAGAGEERPGLRPAKGVHLTVPRERLPWLDAAVLPVPGERRTIFTIPWGRDIYLGTTDTHYDGPLDDPRCRQADMEYVLGAVNAVTSARLRPEDVSGAWAGLRPLLAAPRPSRRLVPSRPGSRATADLSRRHQVSVSSSGLVTVTGGKLTSYRAMAADATDQVVRLLGHGPRQSPTRRLALRGASGLASLRDEDAASRLGADPVLLAHLVARYGGEATALLALVRDDPALALPLVDGLPYVAAEAVYAARDEMALTLDDVLSRRLRALPRRCRVTAESAPRVARLVAGELGWGEEDERSELDSLRAVAACYRVAPPASADPAPPGPPVLRGPR